MKIYNTLTRSLEEFTPIKNNKVSFYHCGPTVYWVQHIGNLRAMTWADLIRRSLKFMGYNTVFVRNYTDVGHLTSDADSGEDKMEKGAKREGLTPEEIADKYIAIFENDTRSLNIIEPDFKPRASQFITQMQDMIQTLLDKGFAYITDMAVVYDVSKFPSYNKLNHQKMESNEKGAGKGKLDDPQKKHFADFNLWVFKKGAHENALQTWSSPWGEGFPGWHIECSVMAKSLLGNTIDIHMGGIEHISVHHTNEIAQSESANGVPFANYWMHNEHLNVSGGKMAKSQGTGFTLQEVIKSGFKPDDLRYFFLGAHYRSKQNFTLQAIKGASIGLSRLRGSVLQLKKDVKNNTALSEDNKYLVRFKNFISNDFQIPQALALMWEMLKTDISYEEKLALVYRFDEVFGLNLKNLTDSDIPFKINELALERIKAKKSGDFKKADSIRNQLQQEGYEIIDTADGYRLKQIGN